MDAKAALRQQLLEARARRAADERTTDGAALADIAVVAWGDRDVVAAYASVRDEPPTRPLLQALRTAGVRVLLPVVAGRRLDWAAYDDWDALVEGPYGLLEPAGPRLHPDELSGMQLVLAPALAVDRRGHRLGQGGGYYDRALAALHGVPAVAVVYDDEVLDELPAEDHDVTVGAALTPGGLLQLRS